MAEKSLGICVGASTIKIVELNEEGKVSNVILKNHECNPKKVLTDILNSLNLKNYAYVTLTGRKFKELLNLPSITEPEATEYALKLKKDKKYNALISLGSENFILYVLNEQLHILDVQTGNKCASGTGEFFLQQVGRMNVSIEKALDLAKNSKPHKVSGRCSVFCKSDCTHALNKGTPIGEVCAGLCGMMANKVKDLLKSLKKEDIMLVGGVTKNKVVMNILKKEIKNLEIPPEADYFEALGAAFYAMKNKIKFNQDYALLNEKSSFHFLSPIKEAENLVTFKEIETVPAVNNDECILGLDTGSTTTKAILLRTKDNSIVAECYLRTNGDPVGASIRCYKELHKQLNGIKINIIGLGVTGSGRQIAGLHALTESIINEIIAHATAVIYFDKDVDTIFEIGGQDAKYTHITNSVASDYAMNEACSAGTGSFLEEAAKESLGIDVLEIEGIALKSKNPPNFNDQCAAFISSDIKNASHQNIKQEDIVGGLVYSICMNYNNRVKGARPVGKKIFMQGGVCYNKAVPLAMSNIIKKPIIVPPKPGLMGAFGVALEVKNRINLGLLEKKSFDLEELYNRKFEHGKSFKCSGGNENCDRGCEINIIKINGKNYPFGGICNKYYNLRHNITVNPAKLNKVQDRQYLVFNQQISESKKTIGISKSFLTNTLYPLYCNFFTKLGFKVVLPDAKDPEGKKKVNSSFCFPAEISHEFFQNLLKKELDYIFLPHIIELYVEKSVSYRKEHQSTCLILESEPYYLKSAFKNLNKTKLLMPILDFCKGWETQKHTFANIGEEFGATREQAERAFDFALSKQREFFDKGKELGKKALEQLEKDPTKIAVVLFGRAYNSFSNDANMGIPDKFASRNIMVIPYDSLPFEDEPCEKNMTWALGQEILKAASFVKKHPQLFGAFITNFSCGPDSFIVGYFRNIMKSKPSLTLELDSHTADAGINTRVEAFLDIVDRFRKINVKEKSEGKFNKAEVITKGNKVFYKSSDNKLYPLTHKRVHVIFPSMGKLGAAAIAAAFTGIGYRSDAVPVPLFSTLILGRGNTSCKECLPLILTTGSLLEYLSKQKDNDELLVYFMPTASGNCRFAQYPVFLNNVINKNKLENVALWTLTSENSYAGLGSKNMLNILYSIMISDIMDDIKNTLYVIAKDRKSAMEEFYRQWNIILGCLRNGCKRIYKTLENVSYALKKIPVKYPISDAKFVCLLGEIFVRRDEFSCQDIIERLAKRDIIAKRATVLEWLYYVDHLVKNRIIDPEFKLRERMEFYVRTVIQRAVEKKFKKIFSKSGLYHYELLDVDKLIEYGQDFVNIKLTGEPIIVIGAFFKEIIENAHGAISIGPFSCLPTRLVEAILSQESTLFNKIKAEKKDYKNFNSIQKLPFLSLESDGNPFPQIVEARIEAFCLQVERLHKLKNSNNLINNSISHRNN